MVARFNASMATKSALRAEMPAQRRLPVRKEAVHEPGDERRRETRLEAQPVDQCTAAFRCFYPSLMPPQLHRSHRRLFDEAASLVHLQQGQFGSVDRQHAEQQDPAAEHRLAGNDVDVGQTLHAARRGHAHQGKHFRRYALEGGDPLPDFGRRSGEAGAEFDLDGRHGEAECVYERT